MVNDCRKRDENVDGLDDRSMVDKSGGRVQGGQVQIKVWRQIEESNNRRHTRHREKYELERIQSQSQHVQAEGQVANGRIFIGQFQQLGVSWPKRNCQNCRIDIDSRQIQHRTGRTPTRTTDL
ncbi:conserved hypothetical protein, partial [Trichinella spiralis]|uniref:hypothetical protein n=1 Tax=Trichinella spiralis TaxID=6334 RepID=UPI0001EFD48A